MKLLITMKLLNDGLEHHIRPKSEMDKVEEIDIVRDFPGPKLPKVTYYSPHKLIRKFTAVNIIWKQLVSICLSLIKKPDIIMSYYMFPHGIIAFITAKVTKKPISHSVIHINEMAVLGIFFSKLHITILKHCDIVTVTGSKTKDKLIRHGVDPNKIYILPHAIDDKKFYPASIPKKYDVLYLGRLTPRKHIDIILKAIQKVKIIYKKNIKVCIAGGVSEGTYKNDLKNLCKELGITENVEFVGYISDTSYYYNISRIYVLASEGEGLPFTIIESMACGVPVIVTDVGDTTDVAKNNVNSIVIKDYSDVNAFANAIIKLLNDEQYYNMLRENALKEVKKNHLKKNVSETWEEIFKRLKIYE